MKLTKSQSQALEWLKEHGNTGIFDKHGVLLAAGESAPFMRMTWNALRDAGLVKIYKPNEKGASRIMVMPHLGAA